MVILSQSLLRGPSNNVLELAVIISLHKTYDK